jgi:DNA ligase (NAD+)
MSKEEVRRLERSIVEAQDAYYNGQPIISDSEFDTLVDELRSLHPKSKILQKVGAPPREDSRLKKVKHEIPMGSLNKVNSEEELDKWLKKCKCDKHTWLIAQEKLDGFSVEIIYEKGKFKQAITRGDGTTGEDITHNAKYMRNVPAELPANSTVNLRGEAVIELADFEKHFYTGGYANPRNAAAGIARKKDTDLQLVKHIKVVYFDCVSEDMGFDTESEKLGYIKKILGLEIVKSSLGPVSKIKQLYKKVSKSRDKLSHEIDALVVKISELAVQDDLGDLHGRPRGQIAWKFAAEMKKTTVREITWEVGLTGRVTPVANLRAVRIGGVEIRRASLHNVKMVRELGVSPGAEVLVSRRNDVIPYIEEVIKSNGIEFIPEDCPVCDKPLEEDGEFLVCTNRKCQARVFGDIQKWINVTEMDDIGPQFVKDLLSYAMIQDPADLYWLKVDDLEGLPGFGEKKAKRAIRNIQAKRELPLAIFLKALNIPYIGASTFQTIIDAGYDTIDKMKEASVSELVGIFSIGHELAKMVIEGLKEKELIIDKLLKWVKIEEKIEGKFTGQSFCFTGALEIRRSDAQKLVKDLGGEVKTSVSKGLTYLVQADPNSMSGKSQKARKYGTKIISEEEFMEMVDFSIDKLTE